MFGSFRRLIKEEDGQDLIEYILITAFIGVGLWITIQASGQSVSALWDHVETSMEDAASLM